jgi:hypothetical protein
MNKYRSEEGEGKKGRRLKRIKRGKSYYFFRNKSVCENKFIKLGGREEELVKENANI